MSRLEDLAAMKYLLAEMIVLRGSLIFYVLLLEEMHFLKVLSNVINIPEILQLAQKLFLLQHEQLKPLN